MDKRKKVFLIVALDFLLVAIVIFSVYMMLNTKVGSILYNIFMIGIVISIPIAFFITYVPLIGNKYDFDESQFENGDESNNIEEAQENTTSKETKEDENGF